MADAGFDVTVLPKKKSARYATTRTIRTTRATQNKQQITSKRASSAKAQKKSSPQILPSVNTSDSLETDDEQTISCPRCLLALKGQGVKCDVCLLKMHVHCTSVPSEVYPMMIKYKAEIGWVCADFKETMKTSYRGLKSSIAVLTEDVSIVRTQLNNMHQEMLTTKVDIMEHHILILIEELSKIRIQLDSMQHKTPITTTNEMEHFATMLSNRPRQIKSDIICKNEHCSYDDTHISLVVYRH